MQRSSHRPDARRKSWLITFLTMYARTTTNCITCPAPISMNTSYSQSGMSIPHKRLLKISSDPPIELPFKESMSYSELFVKIVDTVGLRGLSKSIQGVHTISTSPSIVLYNSSKSMAPMYRSSTFLQTHRLRSGRRHGKRSKGKS